MMQSNCAFHSCLFSTWCLCVKPVSLSAALGPHGGSLAVELLHDSIPHQLLETAKKPYISLRSSMSWYVHKNTDLTLRSPVMQTSLAPPRRPSGRTLVTFNMNVSYTTQIFSAVWSSNGHHQKWFQRALLYISLRTSTISQFCKTDPKPTTGEPNFASITHISRQLQVRDPTILSLEWRK